MPNEVYATARRQLAEMLSPRAAERVLDDALASVRVSSEAVTPRQMRALITGPIQDDLRAVLPPAGLNRTLRKIMEDLRAMSPTPPVEALVEEPPSRASEALSPRDTPSAPPSHDGSAPEPASETVATAGEKAPGTVVSMGREAVAAPPASAPLLAARLPVARLEEMARAFARLEDVIAVAVVRDGKAGFVRGDAFDASAAASLVPIAATVLGRQGAWRSYTLVHDSGTMFIIPVGDDFIVLVGRPEFNLGAVLVVLTTLEEDL